ncbi:MAG: cysteine desulfurase family protein [Alphaproteobacteria bacterium]|nr:cysteine desulfurase family protein [Alphaproteobacteria bacterium]
MKQTTDIAYLDYNATAPVRPGVVEAAARAMAEGGNPSSVHAAGRAARHVVEQARETVAALVGAASAQVVFTGSGTEANTLALKGAGRGRVLISAIEHDSVLRAAPEAEIVPVEPSGVVDLSALEARLAEDGAPALLSLMAANNETGVIQPVLEAAAIAKAHGALVHCDAVQAAGRIPVDMAALGVDLVTLSAHKLGGPQGVGALIVADEVALSPQIRGGGQERGRRAGTENVPGIAGFGVAAQLASSSLEEQGRIAALRDRLEAGIAESAPDAVIFGRERARLPNTTCVALPGMSAETQVMSLDLAGVAVSAGAACSSGKVAPSHVLGAMGIEPALARCAIRVSLGWASQPSDVDRFLDAWRPLRARARRPSAAA